MKILHVTPSFDTSAGGVAYALRNIAESIRGVDAEQVILTAGDADLSVAGVPVVRFPVTGRFRAPAQFSAWLANHVDEFDLVHIHSLWLFHSRVAARAALAAGVPYVVSPCGMLDAWSLAQKAMKKRIYLTLFEKHVLNNAAALHCTVPAEAQSRCISRLAVPTEVIALAVEEAFFEDLPVSRNLAQVLYLGRLDPKKQPDVLIGAFLQVARERPELRLVIAGSGDEDYVRQLKRLAAPCGEQVAFVGTVTGAEKVRLFRQSSIFALPSLHENFGIAVAEAMAAGAVPIISDQVALLDVVAEQNAGFVCAPDSDAFRAALHAALVHADLEAIRANAVHYASAHYSQRATGSQFLEFYRRHARTGDTDAAGLGRAG